MSPNPASDPPRWPRRLALFTALCAVPLVLFGGSVTTLGAGMAVDGWLVAEGHFLPFFPVEKWFRDTATFVEHTHRLFGVLVGLGALATCAATLRSRGARRAARWTSVAALLAVTGQGALGGLRVLEASPELAFLHAAAAQAVFALLAVLALLLGRSWSAPAPARAAPAGLRWLAVCTPFVVYAQIVVGAMLRHALRPVPSPQADPRLALHLVGAFVALAFVVAFALSLLRHRERERSCARAARRLGALLAAQILLGLMAWVGGRPAAGGETIGPLEWSFTVLHVLGGALLLAQTTCASLLTLRRRASALAVAPAGARLEGAR